LFFSQTNNPVLKRLRVTPAAHIPMIVGQQGGRLAIGNLQPTPLASLAKLNAHTICDDLMQKLMAILDIPIPQWELHRRIRLTIKEHIDSTK